MEVDEQYGTASQALAASVHKDMGEFEALRQLADSLRAKTSRAKLEFEVSKSSGQKILRAETGSFLQVCTSQYDLRLSVLFCALITFGKAVERVLHAVLSMATMAELYRRSALKDWKEALSW